MTNQALFVLDPTAINLKNEGVAKVRAINEPDDLTVAEYELQTFVCEGEYHDGLKKMLQQYLTHFGGTVQPAFWVSGFFGSGKSHLVKMACYLWDDFPFPNGRTARTIKPLPPDIQDDLAELQRKQNTYGKLVIAGTLRDFPSKDIRYSFLQILLNAMGLPQQVHHFKFVRRLMDEGIYEQVKTIVESGGKSFIKEVSNLHVSPALARAVLELKPEMAANEAALLQLFKENFKKSEAIGREEFIDTIRNEIFPIAFGDKIPCTLIVLDEVQQFIGLDADLAFDIQMLAEDLCSRFDGRFLLVGTGQNALNETPILSKLLARFRVPVQLSNTDIQRVIRKTILEKRPTAVAEIDRKLEASLGEISRNLQGSAFRYEQEDRTNLVADYPILPSTRKFWYRVLQVVDVAGMAGQLRNQLRLIDESLKQVATEPLGRIVPADAIFTQLRSEMLQAGILLNETSSQIQSLKGGEEDDMLCGRILSAVFLIDQVTANIPNTGLKSDKTTIADMLVDSLNQNSAPFREKIAGLIDQLAARSLLMRIENEFKLQTKIGAEWEREYTRHYASLNHSGEDKIQTLRKDRLMTHLREKTRGLNITQGTSRIVREFELWDKNTPPSLEQRLYLWIRDGWSEAESVVDSEIRAAGVTTPLAYVFVGKMRDQDLRTEILKYLAAEATLDTLGLPGTPEGEQARRSMETRKTQAATALKELIGRICDDARILLAGGTSIQAATLTDSIREALQSIADRQFSEFASKADHANWGTALMKARAGDPEALNVVGHRADVTRHPVATEILRFLGITQKTGREIRNHFTKAPFGWPQDAVDAVVHCLKNAAVISCPEADLTGAKFNQATFKREKHPLPGPAKIELRKLLQDAGINCPSNQEIFPYTKQFLQKLMALAGEASGDPPRPAPFDLSLVHDIENLEGNERLISMVDQKDNLLTLYQDWRAKAETVRLREQDWQTLQKLAEQAVGEPDLEIMQKDVQAIHDDRLLLQEPDPISPLLHKLSEKLLLSLNTRKEQFISLYDKEMAHLQADPHFSGLTPEQKRTILVRHHIVAKPEIKSSDPQALLNQLVKAPLSHWDTRIVALPNQFQAAREEAVMEAAPKAQTYTLPKKTLSSAAEIDEYVNTLRAELEELLKSAPSIILK